MKPGYKTSEFWFTLVSFIFSGLFLLGIIKENDTKEELISVVAHAVESIILIAGQLVIFYRYIKGRKEYRIEYEKNKNEQLEGYIGVGKQYNHININNAALGELIQLPHIGPATAQNIIDYRIENNGFRTAEELINVNGIAKSTLNEIRDYILV